MSVIVSNHALFCCRMGYSFEKIPESNFQPTDSMLRQTALSVASSWNCAADSLKSISSGSDSVLLFKVLPFYASHVFYSTYKSIKSGSATDREV